MPIIVELYILTAFGSVILLQPTKELISDKRLKLLILLLLYAATIRIALGLDVQLPFFFHVSTFLTYALFIPASYLYLRNSIYGGRLKKSDVIHFTPFLILCGCGLLSLLLSINFESDMRQMWSLTAPTLYDSKIMSFLFLFVYCLTAFYFFLVLLLLKKTVLLKEKTVSLIKDSFDNDPSEKADIPHQSLMISKERMIEINCIVKEVLDEKKPYLRQRYSLRDLAIDTNIPLHYLSAYINKFCGKNFNDFINEFRVLYCKEKIQNEEYKYKKLEAIAEESGFNNRNTFAIAFKKVTGLNPSEFLRSVKSSGYLQENVYVRPIDRTVEL